jgi:Putative  PD-(D/E)XK family member, (DUF4420)
MINITDTAEFILEAFESLGRRALPAGSLDAKRIPGRTDTFIAVSASLELFLLLEVDQATLVAERQLKALRVLTGDDFSIVEAATNKVVRRRFAVVALRPGHEDLASSFAVVAATLLATLAVAPTADDVINFLDCIVELVAPKQVAAAATVVGLWGELWLIASAAEPAIFAAAWHSGSGDRFDFSFPHTRMEVKTTARQGRVHEFGLEQLDVSDVKPTWIASLAIVSDPNGQTVMDLLSKLLDLLPGTLAARVSRIALGMVAGDIESVQDFTFAPIGAEALLIFNSRSIPRVTVPSGVGIDGVRFRIDLDRVEPTARSAECLDRLLKLKS